MTIIKATLIRKSTVVILEIGPRVSVTTTPAPQGSFGPSFGPSFG